LSVSGRALTMDREIKQILPCTDPWYARYVGPDGKKEFFKVICWALCIDRGSGVEANHVIGIVSGDGCHPMEADYHNHYQGVELLLGETAETVVKE